MMLNRIMQVVEIVMDVVDEFAGKLQVVSAESETYEDVQPGRGDQSAPPYESHPTDVSFC
jgi:hypothetical protein